MLSDLSQKTLYNLINLEDLKKKNENEKKNIIKGVLNKIKITNLFPIDEYIIENKSFQETNNDFSNNINNTFYQDQSLTSTKDNSEFDNNESSYINEINFINNDDLDDKIIDIIYQKIIDIKLYPGSTIQQRQLVLYEWIKNILPNFLINLEE